MPEPPAPAFTRWQGPRAGAAVGAAALHTGFAETEPGCGKEFYAYDCDQEAAALWYHAPDRQLFPRI